MYEMFTLPEMHNLDYLPLDDTTLMEDETGYFWPYYDPIEAIGDEPRREKSYG